MPRWPFIRAFATPRGTNLGVGKHNAKIITISATNKTYTIYGSVSIIDV